MRTKTKHLLKYDNSKKYTLPKRLRNRKPFGFSNYFPYKTLLIYCLILDVVFYVTIIYFSSEIESEVIRWIVLVALFLIIILSFYLMYCNVKDMNKYEKFLK